MQSAETVSGKVMTKRIVVVSILVIVAGALAISTWSPSRNRRIRQERSIECLNNLQQIDSAIIATAFEGGYRRGDSIPTSRIVACLKDGKMPSCPSGGNYVVPALGGHPTCSYHGDLLAEEGILSAEIPAVPTGAVSNR